ncbi:MAG: hypothetical protein IJ465_07970 [Clostridia bacterium]|nr:hypothetical protein [Clostridia bacterium]
MEDKQNWTYCVVGNIRKTYYDPDGTLRYGTAAFTGGTKVYLCGRVWDRTRNEISVIGKNRGNRFQVAEVDIRQIENVRCRRAFNTAVLEIMNDMEFYGCWWGKSKKEKASAEEFAQWWNQNVSPLQQSEDAAGTS